MDIICINIVLTYAYIKIYMYILYHKLNRALANHERGGDIYIVIHSHSLSDAYPNVQPTSMHIDYRYIPLKW